MTRLPYGEWGDATFRQYFMSVDGGEVSYWASKPRPHLPTLLLVHGITGDHNGLIPLAYELYEEANIILLELPGHGNSERQLLANAHDFQVWFDHTFVALSEAFPTIDWIVAHSFGCSAVIKTKRAKVILLCPVPNPSKLYRQYAWIVMQLAPLWAFFYSWKIFIWLRGMALRKVHTLDAQRRIRWAGFQSHASYSQIIYQAKLVNIILDRTTYQTISERVKLVIAGLEDTTAQQRDSAELGAVFTGARIEFLRGGHLLPIESPDRTAAQIKRVL